MATIEQMEKCKDIFNLALIVTAQGRERIHVEYSAHIDALTIYKAGNPDGWDCNDRHIYLGACNLAERDSGRLDIVKSELESMLAHDEDGVPL